MATVGETIVGAIADLGVSCVWGVVGDALNPITDAVRREPRLEWIGVRHEEAGAFAAGAQAQLSGTPGVCMGTVGPGCLHLLNGLYDAKKSHAPMLAICGQVPLAELGSDFFQEIDNDAVFRDVAVFCRTITSPEQLPGLLRNAVNVYILRICLHDLAAARPDHTVLRFGEQLRKHRPHLQRRSKVGFGIQAVRTVSFAHLLSGI